MIHRLRARVRLIALCLTVAAAALLGGWKPVDLPNHPIGQAKGIRPGRVVWVHDPNVARWDGKTASWYSDDCTDANVADAMVARAIRMLAGAETDTAAWDALFRHFNKAHGRGDVGYKRGEKIVIKLNLNSGSCSNTPQVTAAMLRQLVKQAGAAPEDITLCDASRGVISALYDAIRSEFPKVRSVTAGAGGRGEVATIDRKVALFYADPNIIDSGATYFPTCITEARYMINLAVLKAHDLAGVTLCAKNHFGSVYRDRDANNSKKGWSPGNMHDAIAVARRPMGSCNPLVDLMGHKELGGKTMLYFIDGLYASPRQSVRPAVWRSAPFNGGWTASVFASQDPVAIESVAVDFFAAESVAPGKGTEADAALRRNVNGSVDNYLHEAALADKPPSGAKYDPEGDGTTLPSLGVHEHWNSPARKQYSRNLGKGEGIELIISGPGN